jgi:serine/threonine protein kinase
LAEASVRSPVAAGDVLAGKYRVERVLGVGGMGVVVAARHLQLDELVAVKFLRDRVIDEPEIVVRFLREARAVAKLKSEHVVRVRDVGNLDNGAPYIVMELLDGETLKDRVKRDGKMPPAQAVDCVLQVCDAIAEAHAHGIVHRDIKPTNIFLSYRPDGRMLVKVFDFGISKQIQPPSGDLDGELGMTATTSMLGSPLYMSPEQMISSRNVDARTDIWSLGVTLYLLAAGVLPFRADTMPQVCALVLGDTPKRLDTVVPEVQSGLADVVARCLQKDPELRFPNVAELAAALEPYGTELSVGASRRVSSMLRVPVPPASGRGTAPSFPTATVLTGAPAMQMPPEQTDVSFGEASRSPLSGRSGRPRGRGGKIGLAAALGALAAVGITAAVVTRTPAAAPSATPSVGAANAATDPPPAPSPTEPPLAAVPPTTSQATSDAAAPLATAAPAAPGAPKWPAPAKPKQGATPTTKPGAFDPGSYR